MTELHARPLDPTSFAPFGAVIDAAGDSFGSGEAGLDLGRGTPRFYVMRLEGRPPHFDRITRHRAVTQCLASAGGEPWWLAVATPAGVDDDGAVPDPAQLRAFTIPGDVAVRLHRGTWHAGPFFALPSQAFFNLELADTNEVDHHTVGLGTTYRIVG